MIDGQVIGKFYFLLYFLPHWLIDLIIGTKLFPTSVNEYSVLGDTVE